MAIQMSSKINVTIGHLLFLTVLSTPLWASKQKTTLFSNAIGSQAIGVRYVFTNEVALVETEKTIQAFRSNTLKIALTNK
jgi:hypothetical protein